MEKKSSKQTTKSTGKTKKATAAKAPLKAPLQKKSTAPSRLAEERAEAIGHEAAGRWARAAEAWERAERVAGSKAERREAAGRAAAAKVRAGGKTTITPSLDEALAGNPTAAANAASWDRSMPEPGYVPPEGEDHGEDDADEDDDPHTGEAAATTPTAGATGAPTSEPGNNGSAPAAPVPVRAPRERDPRLPAVGTVIIKKDRQSNERARCTIVEGGVEYAGTAYKSISAAAMAAAKDLGLGSKTQDGYAFWGLKKATVRTGKKDVLESLQKAWTRYREVAAAAWKNATEEERGKLRDLLGEHVTAHQEIVATPAVPFVTAA